MRSPEQDKERIKHILEAILSMSPDETFFSRMTLDPEQLNDGTD
jgi:hypothetical protein